MYHIYILRQEQNLDKLLHFPVQSGLELGKMSRALLANKLPQVYLRPGQQLELHDKLKKAVKEVVTNNPCRDFKYADLPAHRIYITLYNDGLSLAQYKLLKQYLDLADAEGFLLPEDWRTGRGMYLRPLPLPDHVDLWDNTEIAPRVVGDYFIAHPKTKDILHHNDPSIPRCIFMRDELLTTGKWSNYYRDKAYNRRSWYF